MSQAQAFRLAEFQAVIFQYFQVSLCRAVELAADLQRIFLTRRENRERGSEKTLVFPTARVFSDSVRAGATQVGSPLSGLGVLGVASSG